MKVYKEKYVTDAYKNILKDLLNNPEYISKPRGMEVKEIRDCIIEIKNPMINLYKNKHRSSPKKYYGAELLWYFSGTNNPTYIEQHASLWKHIHNPDGTVNSSYGNLLFKEKTPEGLTQYQWVIESLKNDKDSRQAFMHFNKPHHQYIGNKDQVCTLQALFHIRNDELHMTLTMRSNDVVLGFMTDWAFFSVLHYHVCLHMKEYYPTLRMGSYTHISHSMHLYEKHYDLVEKMLEDADSKIIFEPDALPVLSEPILNENGSIKEKYKKLLEPIKFGISHNYNQIIDNPLIQWCLDQLK